MATATVVHPPATPKVKLAGGNAAVEHSLRTGEALEQNVEGHAARTDSATFVQARTALHKMMPDLFGGTNPWEVEKNDVSVPIQAHHGGSIIVKDGKAWRIVLNWAGIEWSEQFSADPVKVDLLRQNAEAIVKAFPDTETAYASLGLPATHIDLVHTPIKTQDDIGRYVDSIYNACVPIPQPLHTGSVTVQAPKASGVHNYPLPAVNIPMFCVADFVPFIVDTKTKTTVTVMPVAARGSGDGRVRVISADSGHPLADAHQDAHNDGGALILDASHPIAKRAFKHQTGA